MAEHNTLASLFSDIADAIRNKTRKTGEIVADDFPEEINNIDDFAFTKVFNGTASSAVFSSSDFSIFNGDEVKIEYGNENSVFGGNLNKMFAGANMAGKKLKVKINGTGVTSLERAFTLKNCPEIYLDFGNNNPTSFRDLFYQTSNNIIKKVSIIGDTSKVTSWRYAFRYCSSLETIDADLDFTSATGLSEVFYQGGKMKDVRVVKNTIFQSIYIRDSQSGSAFQWTNESLIYFANGLNGTVTDKTLTAHANHKTRMNAIMGTVEHIVEGDTEYDFFTEDESGTVTLTEFITDYKGWTIA